MFVDAVQKQKILKNENSNNIWFLRQEMANF
jgi:hypothetical protein